MELAGYKIQPISIFLHDTPEWKEKSDKAKEYFESEGITDCYFVNGIHAEAFGVGALRPYQRDVPDTSWRLEPRTVGNYLSAYLTFSIAQSHPEWKHIMYLEMDTRFNPDWRERLEQALEDVPQDFDVLICSHCCADGRETKHIVGEIYEVKYPLAGHVSIVAHKALNPILNGCRDACTPFDINLFDSVFKNLKVYTILPRLAEQENTHLPL